MSSKIVYVDMVADLFHPGHVSFFNKIRKRHPQAKIYVGLMSDIEATTYKRKPILNMAERVTMLESCRHVDKVYPDAPMPITKEFIVANDIDIVIHSDDLSDESRKYWYSIPLEMNIYEEIPYTKSVSTTEIISRITTNACTQ